MPTALVAAVQDAVIRLSGPEFSALLRLPARTGDRWLAAIRAGDLDCLPPAAIARLVRHEAETTGRRTILDALAEAPQEPAGPADSTQVAHCMGALASSQRSASELLERMATDIADGVFSLEEARRLLPLVDGAAMAAQEKCRALDRLARAIRGRVSGGR